MFGPVNVQTQDRRTKTRTRLGECAKDRQDTRQTPTTRETQDDKDVHRKGKTQDDQSYTRHERRKETHCRKAKMYLVAHNTRHKTCNLHLLL